VALGLDARQNRAVVDVVREHPFRRGSWLAVLAAVLFGVTTPLIQRAGRGSGAIQTAAWLYLGAALASLGGRAASREAPVRLDRLPRLLAIGVAGALVAPACLAWGVQRIDAASASLLLNFEAVFTVLLGWAWFHEHVGRRVGVAVTSMVIGGAFLVRDAHASGVGIGAIAILAATLAWSLDNALTRPLADLDPTAVVRYKGLLGAAFGFLLSIVLRQPLPSLGSALALLAIGATGYGISLRLYILAQRAIGAGRTASIFAIAPFIGAALALAMGEPGGRSGLIIAALLFGIAVYLHATETHDHKHTHEPIEHEHLHRHDDGHHAHAHDPPFVGEHSHSHRHEGVTHDHPHAPDVHHQHRH
jgi:drug/metabolite transporter (DMT)-like permease